MKTSIQLIVYRADVECVPCSARQLPAGYPSSRTVSSPQSTPLLCASCSRQFWTCPRKAPVSRASRRVSQTTTYQAQRGDTSARTHDTICASRQGPKPLDPKHKRPTITKSHLPVMAARANPWAALRGLSIRTRTLRTACIEQKHQTTPASLIHKAVSSGPCSSARRSFADSAAKRDSNITTTSSSTSDPSSPPPRTTTPPPGTAPPIVPGSQVGPYHELFAPNFLNTEALAALEKAAAEAAEAAAGDGLLFHMPDRVGKHEQLQDRYHPVVHQITRLLMRDGKLSKAQTV